MTKRLRLKEERLWWMLLVLADTISEIRNRQGEGEECLQAMRVGNRARRMLVTEFGANLDDLDLEARERFETLLDEEKAKDAKERELHALIDRALEEAQRLLGKKT